MLSLERSKPHAQKLNAHSYMYQCFYPSWSELKELSKELKIHHYSIDYGWRSTPDGWPFDYGSSLHAYCVPVITKPLILTNDATHRMFQVPKRFICTTLISISPFLTELTSNSSMP